jgi:N-acetylglucosamine malate deacetylase 2
VRPLGPAARVAKAWMIAAHASQRAVLEAFPVGDERWREAPPVTLAAPPHPRPLFHEVMGWGSWDGFASRAAEALRELGIGEAEL